MLQTIFCHLYVECFSSIEFGSTKSVEVIFKYIVAKLFLRWEYQYWQVVSI